MYIIIWILIWTQGRELIIETYLVNLCMSQKIQFPVISACAV